MFQKEIIPLFSRPIFKTHLDLKDLNLDSIKWARNYNNWISESQDVLNQPEFSNLAEQVYNNLCEYFYGVMRAKTDIEIAFTESWFNKTENGQSHHRHWHPNSIYSGIVYIKGNSTSGRTKFISSLYETIEYSIVDANIYNSKSWSIDPIIGDMILFPSNVEHLVEPYYGDEPRITLSFNTFIKGPVNIDPLTRLVL